ncbi:MAG: hypothetical protein M1838_004125 [Thelocarpon superellum]|nr:MAG: hypothetical protein M1838_004125 [Thelocarpon superellum]
MLASKYADPPPATAVSAASAGTGGSQGSPAPILDDASPTPLTPSHVKKASDANAIMASPRASDARSPTKPTLTRSSTSQGAKKKIMWKNKACIIAIPSNDVRGVSGGAPRPLTATEVVQRLQRWEDAGFDVRGFGYWGAREVANGGEGVGQSRLIYPTVEHWTEEHEHGGYRVNIPDRSGTSPRLDLRPRAVTAKEADTVATEWEAYVNELKEEKLRALGVSLGDDPPPAAPSPTPSMSRQASSQHPLHTFSPPPLTSSAASNGTAPNAQPFSPFMAGNSTNPSSHVASIASPGLAQAARVTLNGPRPSIAFPVGDRRFGSPSHLPPPSMSPLPNTWLPQQTLEHGSMSRGGSPAVVGDARAEDRSPLTGSPSARQMSPHLPPATAADPPRRSQMQTHQRGHLTQPGPVPLRAGVMELGPRHASPPKPEIITPIPRGHRQNLSESLQKEIEEAEYHLEDSINRQLDADEGFRASSVSPFDTSDMFLDGPLMPGGPKSPSESRPLRSPAARTRELDRCDDNEPAAATTNERGTVRASVPPVLHHPQPHNRTHSLSKPDFEHRLGAAPGPSATGSKLNVQAKEFQAGSGVSFTPGHFSFTGNHFQPAPSFFVPPRQAETATRPSMSNPRAFSSNLNVEAAEFKPGGGNAPTFPTSSFDFDFNFSSAAPSFRPDAPSFTPLAASAPAAGTPAEGSKPDADTGKVMGKIFDASFIVKPPKVSNARAIVRPDEVILQQTKEAEVDEQEDDSGRITQGDARHKRMRQAGDDGDDVPQFAVPTHPLAEASQGQSGAKESARIKEPASRGKENAAPISPPVSHVVPHQSSPATMVPALAVSTDAGDSSEDMEELSVLTAELDAVEEASTPHAPDAFADHLTSNIPPVATAPRADMTLATGESEFPSSDSTVPSPLPTRVPTGLERSRFADVPSPPPMNPSPATTLKPVDVTRAEDSASEASHETSEAISQTPELLDQTRGGASSPWHASVPSSIAQSPPTWHQRAVIPRSGGPSPEGRRAPTPPSPLPVGGISPVGPRLTAQESPVRRLNTTEDVPASDWDDVLSPSEERKVPSRSRFFDHHIDDLVGRLLQARMAPLEMMLRTMQESVSVLASDHSPSRRGQRHASVDMVDSDADDEDDDEALSGTFPSRARSPRKERKLDRVKQIVLEALAAHQASTPASVASAPAPAPMVLPEAWHDEVRSIMTDVVGQHASVVTRDGDGFREEELTQVKAQISALHSQNAKLRLQLQTETGHRGASEQRLAETQTALQEAQEEAGRLRRSMEEQEQKLRTLDERRHQDLVQTQMRSALLEGAQENLQKKATDLSAKNAALENSLREARLMEERYRGESERIEAGNREVRRTMEAIKLQMEESVRVREGLRGKFDRIQGDMATASREIGRKQATWHKREEEHRVRQEMMSARLEAEARTRERLEREIERLEAQELEAMKMRTQVEQVQTYNVRLNETVQALRLESIEHQQTAARYEGEFNEARDAGRAEVQRTRTLMEADIEAANNEVNAVRARLEAELVHVRRELELSQAEVRSTKAHADRALEEASTQRREAVREAQKVHESTMDSQRQAYERHVDDLKTQRDRDLHHAREDQQRAETHLLERLSLSNARAEHLQDKVTHLEEKLEVAKTAAHAAAQAAQAVKGASPKGAPSAALVAPGSNVPEKVSPQALRESILVLQEQLQAREGRIESLEQELSAVDTDAPNKIRDRDTEIAWLRELLGVRVSELEDIIQQLSQDDYDGDAVKEAAIRLRANLQMEQQERERAMAGGTFPSLASLGSFASPKLPLAAAWGSWQRGRDASLGKLSDLASRGMQTPSRSSPSTQSFLSGLLTPPNTTRQTPLGSGASQRGARSIRAEGAQRVPAALTTRHQERQAVAPAPTTPPLMRRGSYDEDAASSHLSAGGFYDDDESTVDGHADDSRDPRDSRGSQGAAPFGPSFRI